MSAFLTSEMHQSTFGKRRQVNTGALTFYEIGFRGMLWYSWKKGTLRSTIGKHHAGPTSTATKITTIRKAEQFVRNAKGKDTQREREREGEREREIERAIERDR